MIATDLVFSPAIIRPQVDVFEAVGRWGDPERNADKATIVRNRVRAAPACDLDVNSAVAKSNPIHNRQTERVSRLVGFDQADSLAILVARALGDALENQSIERERDGVLRRPQRDDAGGDHRTDNLKSE